MHTKEMMREEVIKSLDYSLMAIELTDKPLEDYKDLCRLIYVEAMLRKVGGGVRITKEEKKMVDKLLRDTIERVNRGENPDTTVAK